MTETGGEIGVLVMGAGAVGGYFGACLVRAGHDVTFVARGANLERCDRDGLRVTGAMGEIGVGGGPGDGRSVVACAPTSCSCA